MENGTVVKWNEWKMEQTEGRTDRQTDRRTDGKVEGVHQWSACGELPGGARGVSPRASEL